MRQIIIYKPMFFLIFCFSCNINIQPPEPFPPNQIPLKPDSVNTLNLTGFVSLSASPDTIPFRRYKDKFVVITLPDSSKFYGLSYVYYGETWEFEKNLIKIYVYSDVLSERGEASAVFTYAPGNLLTIKIISSNTTKYKISENYIFAYKVLDSIFNMAYKIDATNRIFTGPGIIRRQLYIGTNYERREFRYLQDSYMN